MEEFYGNRLSKEKQRVYYQIRQGLTEMAPSFSVNRLEGPELQEIFSFVRMDHPEIFYAPSFSYRFYPQADSVEFLPEYLFKKKDIQEHQRQLQARIRKLIMPVKEKSEWEKEQFVHDFICQNVHYDKLKKAYSHEIIGPLTQGVGVCEGIAKTVKILCDELKIYCVLAFCHNNPEKNIKYRHCWNIVKLGGKYYHLDATFDNTLTSEGEIRYDYFNIDDQAIFRDHEPLVWPVPPCTDHSHFFYLEKKLSFTKMQDVKNRAQQAAKKNKILTFHWRGGYLTREILKEICVSLEEAGKEKGKAALLSLNWPQAVMRVRYEALPEAAEGSSAEETDETEGMGVKITMEEANEGEKE